MNPKADRARKHHSHTVTISMHSDHKPEPLWHVQIAVLIALALQIGLPDRLVVGPRYLLPALEALLLLALSLMAPKQQAHHFVIKRTTAISMIVLTSLANMMSLALLVRILLQGKTAGGAQLAGSDLLLNAVNIFCTNIIVFGLWYWEMDGGGPTKRRSPEHEFWDFLFPQILNPEIAPPRWRPAFVDYLYVAATNATAFSPTDTLPLTHRAKLVMLLQALVSLLTVALVAARAVNILAG